MVKSKFKLFLQFIFIYQDLQTAPSIEMQHSPRYSNSCTKALDKVSYALFYPLTTAVSFFMSCYISNILEKHYPQRKLLQYFIFGPLSGVLIILLLPTGILGAVIWICLCSFADNDKYTYCVVKKSKDEEKEDFQTIFDSPNFDGEFVLSFATANVLLGPDFLNKLNNNTSAYLRCSKIGNCIVNNNKKHLKNFSNSVHKSGLIISQFPLVDFFCFQEVWERFHALVLMKSLSKEFEYFIYDVGEYNFKTNLCLFGSGLMFASKKPILEADFKTYSVRTKHAKFVSLGVLCIKVLLDYSKNGIRYVGYISNLHTQAFQGNDPVIYSQLSETLTFVEKFKESKSQAGDVVKFDIMSGDFNADNMSPGDEDIQNHPLFEDYVDVCIEKPGKDNLWAIGTELRQMMLFHPSISTPEIFKEALIDDSLRRLYVLDADVMVHHPSLMTTVAKPDSNGKIKPLPYGGMRRVDKILINHSIKVETLGYGFVSALTHMSDHLPVCMTIKTLPSRTPF